MDKLIELGNCKKPHGVKGAFSFFLINQKDSSLKKGSFVTLIPLNSASSIDPNGQEFEISSIGHGNKTIVTLKGVDNRNLVEAMIPFSIHIKRSELPELDDDNYYLSDLIGLKAIDEDGKSIGTVIEMGTNGVQEILRIKGESGVLEILLVDHFVKEINWDEGTIIVVVPELV